MLKNPSDEGNMFSETSIRTRATWYEVPECIHKLRESESIIWMRENNGMNTVVKGMSPFCNSTVEYNNTQWLAWNCEQPCVALLHVTPGSKV
jgi:hypothetical protein